MCVRVCRLGALRPCHAASWRTCVQRKTPADNSGVSAADFQFPSAKYEIIALPISQVAKLWTTEWKKKKHWRLNLLFVIQQNKTITSQYGLITEINLGVDTENVDRRRGGRAPATPGRENRHQSQTSLTSFPMHDSGSSIQKWKSGTAAAALQFKTQAQQRA